MLHTLWKLLSASLQQIIGAYNWVSAGLEFCLGARGDSGRAVLQSGGWGNSQPVKVLTLPSFCWHLESMKSWKVQVLWVACTQYSLLMAEPGIFSVVHWFPSSGEQFGVYILFQICEVPWVFFPKLSQWLLVLYIGLVEQVRFHMSHDRFSASGVWV